MQPQISRIQRIIHIILREICAIRGYNIRGCIFVK